MQANTRQITAQEISSTEKREIFAAMSQVMAEIGPISKARSNTMQNYKFRGIDDIYNAIQGPLSRHGVFCTPEVLEEKREERQTRDGKGVLIYTILKIRYTFHASDGSNVSAVVIGEAMDSSDKSANKAMSAAQKYAFLQIFNIPTEEEKDTEHSHHEPHAKEPTKPAYTPKPSQGGGYVCDFGKHAGKAIKDVPVSEWNKYLDWLKSEAKKTGKPLSQKAVDLENEVNAYLDDDIAL